ncbi:MAG: 2-C-methyl-D-erythritol 2,4-cyclodiphosphate synthase [Desulfobacteraceae bacterium]
MDFTDMRVGSGYDAHRFVKGRPLVLGGETIPFEMGLEGHSDADVLLHSVCDAMLGAAGLGDIGEYFPDDDPQYLDISSLILVEKCSQLLYKYGYRVVNLDVTVMAEKPKLGNHKRRMAQNIASAAGIDPGRVCVKATTNEGLGFIGRQEGICAQAIVLLTKIPG